MRREARYDFVQRLLGSGFDFGHCLILDWMGHVNGVEVRSSQSGCLRACRESEFMRRDGYRRNAPIFELDGVVQTARCARPSIGQSFHDGIHAFQLL